MPPAPLSLRKRRIRRILAVLILTPCLLLALANVLLATPWVRGTLGRKFSARLGVETTIGQVTCTPWGGLAIGNLQCLQPPALRGTLAAPLLEVREIRAHPQWGRLLRGDLAFSYVRIERPRLTLSLEMAATMVSAGAATPGPVGTTPPLVASAETAAGRDGNIPEAPAPLQGGSRPPVPDSSSIGTAWVEIVDAGCELWLSGTRVVSLRGGEGKVPFAGAPSFSRLQLREFEVLGKVIARDLVAPLSWRAPELRCDVAEFLLAGLQVKVSAALGVTPGSPFALAVFIPRQRAGGGSSWFQHVKPVAGHLEARLQMLGFVRHPSTWQGIATALMGNVTMQPGGQAVAFDEGRANLVLQGGVLQCPDIRLTGERASFLGNGQLHADGQGAGVLRVVVPPDAAIAWTQRLTAAGLVPVFAPLETPDRMFIDLRWISYSGGQAIELGAGGPLVPAGEFVTLLSGGG